MLPVLALPFAELFPFSKAVLDLVTDPSNQGLRPLGIQATLVKVHLML